MKKKQERPVDMAHEKKVGDGTVNLVALAIIISVFALCVAGQVRSFIPKQIGKVCQAVFHGKVEEPQKAQVIPPPDEVPKVPDRKFHPDDKSWF